MQALKKKTAMKLHNRIEKALDDESLSIEELTEFLGAAAKFFEATKTIEVLEIKDIPAVLGISENHARTWAKHPDAPCVRVGDRVLWPLHTLYQWLSVPQNFADLSKYRSA